jgi:hypothetical protein
MMLVFQYGSNAWAERLNSADRLRGDARDLGLVSTESAFELSFDVWSTKNDCAAANLRQSAGRQIWGVLYEVPEFLMGRDTRTHPPESKAASRAAKARSAHRS